MQAIGYYKVICKTVDALPPTVPPPTNLRVNKPKNQPFIHSWVFPYQAGVSMALACRSAESVREALELVDLKARIECC